MRKLATAACVGVVMSLAGAMTASAGTLDQQQEAVSNYRTVGFCDLFLCGTDRQFSSSQSFTAGATGPLDQVDLHIAQAAATQPLTVQVRGAAGNGCPTDDILASATVGPAGVSSPAQWVAIPFAAPAAVTAGTQYTLVASTELNTAYAWSFEGVDAAYGGGTRCDQVAIPPGAPPGPWEPKLGDHAFRTYVKTRGGGGGGGDGRADGKPETTITKGPKKRTAKRTLKFRFEADAQGATFECRLKGKGAKRGQKRWKSCKSPKKYKRLAPGKYRFLVVATTAAGADPTPAKRKFRVLG